jgi:signal transduction histidine kinase
MNSYATLSLVYFCFTLISTSILYGSFRKKMDASANYFLISEICTGATCAQLLLRNTGVIEGTPLWNGVGNFASLGAEVAILLSLLSLTKSVPRKWVFIAPILLILFCATLEYIRVAADLKTVILIFSIVITCIFSASFFICKFKFQSALANNQFMKLFRWCVIGMIFYGLIRIAGYFANSPVVPRDTPNNLNIFIFTLFIVLGSFRYISYIGLRITWVDPTNPSQNLLNRPLVKIIKEKDHLLRGLIDSNRVIGISALASSLAHQLSQPLTTIALRADTIRRDLAKSSQDQQLAPSLDEISLQSSKLAELVQNLRQLFGTKSDEFAPINLRKITDEIIDIVEPSLQAKKILLNKEYIGDQVVYGDSIQIQQVLINVFNNAIDELTQNNSDQKVITIRLEGNEKFANIIIKDNGAGINPATLSTIFELYKTSKKGGLGVGLWLCKTIIERHNGRIQASNDPKGGAIFKIEIPMHSGLEK